MDVRTEEYLKVVKSNMNYIGSNCGWDGIHEILKKSGVCTEVRLEVEYDDMAIYSYELKGKQRFCVEVGYRIDIDDYQIETHVFTEYPSAKSISVARMISDLEFMFKVGRLSPVFTCWECGRECHWLDIPGTLKKRVDNLKDGYCGC